MHNLTEKLNIDNNVRQLLSACSNTVKAKYPEAEIILYGSYARGQQTKESDIDLLILLHENITAETRKIIHSLIYDIALDKDVVISSIIKSSEKWNMPICQATGLYQAVQREGIKVA